MGLDGVELILGWEEAFGISISESAAQSMHTPDHATDYIYSVLKRDDPEDDGRLSLRAFFRLRSAFKQQGFADRRIDLKTKISALLPGRDRRERLNMILVQLGFSQLPRLPFGLQFTAATIGDLVLDRVTSDADQLRKPGYGWSKQQVREVVRAVMAAQLNLRHFADSAHFRTDLGIG